MQLNATLHEQNSKDVKYLPGQVQQKGGGGYTDELELNSLKKISTKLHKMQVTMYIVYEYLH